MIMMITKEYQEKGSRGVVSSLGKGVCEPRHSSATPVWTEEARTE